jgi:RimJ/RimL family protein N-acetyltransferase
LDRIIFNHEGHGYSISSLTGTRFDPKKDTSIGRVHNGKLVGGVLFTDYTGESISIHTASWDQHWISRDLLFVVFDYPFNQLEVKRIFGRVPESNYQALRFNRHCGFRDVARVEGVYKHNIAQIVMRCDREDCRFLGIKPRGIQSNRN